MRKELKKETHQTVHDFPLQMNCQVTLEEYKKYALWAGQKDRGKTKKRCVIQSAVLLAAGAAIVYQGFLKQWAYHDILTVLGILLIGYAIFDVVLEFLLFPVLLGRNVAKEFHKDARLGREMTFCFAEDRMVSFYNETHQGTFYYDDVIKKEEIDQLILISLKNGKTMVFPKRVIEKADPKIQSIIAGLGS